MPAREDITYFGAGPALLPTDVLKKAAEALVDFQGTGLGLAEHSHRSEIANTIINEAKADLASFLDIPDDYEILFMQGGGTGEFSATAYNLVGSWVANKREEIFAQPRHEDDGLPSQMQLLNDAVNNDLKLDYIITGSWSAKAAAESARLFGQDKVNVAVDARLTNNGKFGIIPDESTWKLSKDAALVYFCANETVDGVEFQEFPKVLTPGPDGKGPIVVADMSSNILSRKIDVKNYSLIFFGAQKNLGSAGITNNSLYNTLSIFDVYIAGQVLKKALATYPDKVSGQETLSKQKAELIYNALDSHPDVYRIVPHKSVRSRMNICFRVTKGGDIDAAEKDFLKQSTALGLTGLKGHRSVGGIRASNYNSIALEGAQKLAQFLVDFAKAS
ncbi:hypothetical protein TrVGV298_000442 [Trichoderma virens]|nr:hypothetical protein TrVGV298_000442 [Trichoderma virens]